MNSNIPPDCYSSILSSFASKEQQQEFIFTTEGFQAGVTATEAALEAAPNVSYLESIRIKYSHIAALSVPANNVGIIFCYQFVDD
jgi:hypothetical protein